MKTFARISGIDNPSLGQVLRDELVGGETSALGVVSAFVSIGGFRDLLAITRKRKSLECRLLAGISNAVTHPQALTEALNAGWKVRLGSQNGTGIFHPKLILSGRSFLPGGRVNEPSFVYVGSSNLTKGGLHKNIECGVIAHTDFSDRGLVSCFATLWNAGKPATALRIQSYAEEFARRNRKRSLDDMGALGVSDTTEEVMPTYDVIVRARATRKYEAIPKSVAAAAWAGLESFTGEYKFQVEFPQAAGLVLKRIFRTDTRQQMPILCTEDNVVRDMSFNFYADNGMFRLNIPNDTPGVQRARRGHKGIALVEVSDCSDAAAQLTILPPGEKLEEIVTRSFLLGTWGRTSTRAYGWY
jgi:HKD family nuclease